MDRRDFLRMGTQAALTTGLAARAASAEIATPPSVSVPKPSLLRDFSAEDHRRRLASIAIGTNAIRTCMRSHLVTNYEPAQCCYNLGEYPSTKPWEPGAYDEEELDRLKAIGIQILQVFDDWNDSLRLFGGDKYSAVNPSGYRRFMDMAHARGMKVLTYTSPCFIQRSDPDYRPEWSREGDFLVVGYWDMARCSPASPGWRAFVLQKIARVLDEWGSDGIYVDGGYLSNRYELKRKMPMAKDEIAAFQETPEHDGAFADMLALMYADVKRRGGILKLHVNGSEAPLSGGLLTYDYLWVGEGVAQADGLREAVKNYAPYVVPCIDLGFASVESEDEPFLHAIPYLQFPVMMGGHIFTGERGFVPGVKYNDDFWLKRCREAWAQYQTDPAKLHTYSAWDAVPGNPNTRSIHAKWLKRYLPMVEEGAWAWLEIGDSSLFAEPIPAGVVASAFANRAFWLVVANYGHADVKVTTTDTYQAMADKPGEPSKTWSIRARSLLILKRMEQV